MRRGIQITVILAALWAMVSLFVNWPFQLSYFNELAGGTQDGYLHMRGSSFDWGQDYFLACGSEFQMGNTTRDDLWVIAVPKEVFSSNHQLTTFEVVSVGAYWDQTGKTSPLGAGYHRMTPTTFVKRRIQ